MLDRNKRIKERPQRFQDSKDHFEVVVSLEERVYDQIMEGILIKAINRLIRFLLKSWSKIP